MQYPTNYDVDYGDRDPVADVDPLFHRRWSPRSFCKSAISQEDQAVLFDAARWSPSCFNEQPWLFITSTDAADFDLFLELLMEGNQSWARNASLIGFICARRTFTRNAKPNPQGPFDCGAAWMALALQASRLGLYAHGMAGIKKQEIYQKLNVPEDRYEVMAGFAIGVIDTPSQLTDDLAAMEKPSPRNALGDIWRRGKLQSP